MVGLAPLLQALVVAVALFVFGGAALLAGTGLGVAMWRQARGDRFGWAEGLRLFALIGLGNAIAALVLGTVVAWIGRVADSPETREAAGFVLRAAAVSGLACGGVSLLLSIRCDVRPTAARDAPEGSGQTSSPSVRIGWIQRGLVAGLIAAAFAWSIAEVLGDAQLALDAERFALPVTILIALSVPLRASFDELAGTMGPITQWYLRLAVFSGIVWLLPVAAGPAAVVAAWLVLVVLLYRAAWREADPRRHSGSER